MTSHSPNLPKNLMTPEWPDLPSNIRALSTLRFGGVSLPPYDDGFGGGGFNLGTHVGDDPQAVAMNRGTLRSFIPSEPAWLTQVHGTVVVDAEGVENAPEADASIASTAGAVCVIQTADCLPVLLADTQGRVVGAAHAGWRGLAGGVIQNTIDAMHAAGAGEITAWMGPAIGPNRFEVGEDVKQAFSTPEAFTAVQNVNGKFMADIYHLAREILQKQGIKSVFGGLDCTVSNPNRFFSYRRDKTTGRMASFIWINN